MCILEEGPAIDPKDFGDDAWGAFKTMFRDMNGQIARGRAFIPVIQGRVLGGSAYRLERKVRPKAVSTASAARTPRSLASSKIE